MRFQQFISEDKKILYKYHPLAHEQLSSHLYEVFNTDIHLNVNKSTETEFTSTFSIKEFDYYFMAQKGEDDIWSVSFDLISRRDGSEIFDLLKNETLPTETFSAVIKCMKYLKEKNDIKGMTFNSEIPEMIQFYDNISKFIEKKLKFNLIDRIKKDTRIFWVYGK